jgi:hypothetical protein
MNYTGLCRWLNVAGLLHAQIMGKLDNALGVLPGGIRIHQRIGITARSVQTGASSQ